MVGFEQASIKVEKRQEFEQLRSAIDRAVSNPEKFLKRVDRARLRIRDFDGVLASRVLEQVTDDRHEGELSAEQLYQSLSLSDQGQLRELYLFKVEEIDPKLRAKFHKLYQYY